MNWGSVSEFLHMGGYGIYVWGSYGVTALVLLLEVIFLLRQSRTPTAIAGRKVQEASGKEK
jgi:heme exporter protein D